jgi:hypothetical protein
MCGQADVSVARDKSLSKDRAVIPAEAGIHVALLEEWKGARSRWIPAFAGMTPVMSVIVLPLSRE